MNHENYSFEVEQWLIEEGELAKNSLQSKPFIGDRSYRHFDGRVSLHDMENNSAEFLINELRYPLRLKKHTFFPFVRKDSKVRRFIKEVSLKDGERHDRVVIKQKVRPIMYASHRDTVIYGFYGQMLRKAYDAKIKFTRIDSSAIAYRKIPRLDGSEKNKSNIEFAHDAYGALGRYDKSSVMCLDITNFFGSMLHTKIEESWCSTLGVDTLPAGHKVVFKNITRYRYVFQDEVRVAIGLGEIRNGRFVYKKDLPFLRTTGPLTKNAREYNKVIRRSPLIRVNGSPRGIPQGSPISDILANMYLMEFDKKLNEILSGYKFGLYRRYSDDIFLIFPQEKATEIYKEIKSMLTSMQLTINEDKTELFSINRPKNQLIDETRLLVPGYAKNKTSIQYLGFEFDLEDIHIRSGTIAKHYRKLKKGMKKSLKEKQVEEKSIFKKTKRNRRDRYAYIKQVLKRIGGTRLEKQSITIRKRTAKLRRGNRSVTK